MPVVKIIPRETSGVILNRLTADYLQSEEVTNDSGVIITAGSVVRFEDPTCTENCKILPAIANDVTKSDAIGICPTAVLNGQSIRIAVGGIVEFYLEPGEAAPRTGDFLYLSSVTEGAVTTVIPNIATSEIVAIGKVMQGRVILDIEKTITVADLDPLPSSSLWVKSGDDYYPRAVVSGHTGDWAIEFDLTNIDVYPFRTGFPESIIPYPVGDDIIVGGT